MKKVIKLAFVAVFVAVAGYGVYANQTSNTMSDLVLVNVEALAADSETSKACEQVCYYCPGWQCTRILNGVSSVCYPYRKN